MSDSEDSDDDRYMTWWGRRRKKERKRKKERTRNKSPKPYSLTIQELINQPQVQKKAERQTRKITTRTDDAESAQKSVAKDAAAAVPDDASNSVLQTLLQTPQLADDLVAFDSCGFTLPWAARKGCAPAIASLLQRAPDPAALMEAPDGTGRTALSWAAGEGHAMAVLGLLERGASPTVEDSRGRSPLAWAL
jgi:ankyrin repeat protein